VKNPSVLNFTVSVSLETNLAQNCVIAETAAIITCFPKSERRPFPIPLKKIQMLFKGK